jgi:hypothetical protein
MSLAQGLLAVGTLLFVTLVPRRASALDALPIAVGDSLLKVPVHRSEGRGYVPAEPLAQALGVEIKAEGSAALAFCVLDVCALVPTDGSDARVVRRDGRVWVSLNAVPELLYAQYAWDEGRGMLTLARDRGGSPGGLSPGQALPPLTLPDLDGKDVSFSSFLGRKMVLFTWASW